MQLHVEIDDALYERGKRAIRAQGFCTTSEFVRQKFREVVKEEKID